MRYTRSRLRGQANDGVRLIRTAISNLTTIGATTERLSKAFLEKTGEKGFFRGAASAYPLRFYAFLLPYTCRAAAQRTNL